MKIIFYVKKRTLLIIAEIVWLIAGFNVASLGVLSYLEINRKWYLYLLSAVVFCLFGLMFRKTIWNMKVIARFGISLI